MAAISLVIGLGNPGTRYALTRHNIGFRVVDALVEKYGGTWATKDEAETAEIEINGHRVIVAKPQTCMNSSGRILPRFLKRGIKPENILIIHDELEFPFGKIGSKLGGSARGHNGLKSIIASCGDQFHRIRCGIGRPENRDAVPDYVLDRFDEPEHEIDGMVAHALQAIEQFFSK